MNAQERLRVLQTELESQGVDDVKFFFALTDEKPLSEVANDVADALRAYVDGRTHNLESFSDSYR